MRTREQIYGPEASAILRDITMYRVLSEEQIYRLCLCKSGKNRERIKKFLGYLVKQQRVWLSENGALYCASPDALIGMDRSLFAAVWVLTDFIDQAEFHSVGDYPAKIIFFAGGEVYEIIYAARGKETLLSHVLSDAMEQSSHYIILVDDPAQIPDLEIPKVNGYCTVSEAGKVEYYRKEGDSH